MRTRILAVLSAFLLLAATGCGNDDSADASDTTSGGGLSVKIAEPADGASVNTPFTVRVDSSVPLGPTESGRHHVHVWFDDKADDYQVVEADHVDVKSGDLASGQHVVHVSLRNANHSPAGAETQETVMVSGAGAPAAPTEPSPTDNGGYGY